MIVQFRNEKVSNHGSIPITIDCNVVAFIVFDEGFHQPIKRAKHCDNLNVPQPLYTADFQWHQDSNLQLDDAGRDEQGLVWHPKFSSHIEGVRALMVLVCLRLREDLATPIIMPYPLETTNDALDNSGSSRPLDIGNTLS
ncbi:hypothetical protein TNCV_922281 [Trichonephila clavipes]|nr:hypothetical protein TNCV_922281 [Trichonephila clavipes]